MSRILIILICLISNDTLAQECVVLLHGLAKTATSMNKIERVLLKEGYDVVNTGYPSTKASIELLANTTIVPALEECNSRLATKINFVTHSLGGILVRQYLSANELPNLKRVVMLGPPNGGSELIDRLSKVPGFKNIGGPASVQLGTGDRSVPKKLGPVNFDLGVIAGDKTFNPILSIFLPSRDDGKVTVENAKVNGMCGFIIMPTSHVFIMKNNNVINQVISFLKTGQFNGAGAVRKSCKTTL